MDIYRQKKQELESMPKEHPDYQMRFQELFNLFEEIRMNSVDILEVQPNFIPPNVYDVMLTDLNHALLMSQVSQDLNIQYLTEPEKPDEESLVGIVSGILWGPHLRPLINLVMSSTIYKKSVNIIFLVDTGCPYIYICEQALTSYHTSTWHMNVPPQKNNQNCKNFSNFQQPRHQLLF